MTRVGPRPFDGDGLTAAGLRGGDYAAAELAGRAGRPPPPPPYAGESVPWSTSTTATSTRTGHRQAARSAAWRAELTHVDRLVEQLADALPAGTRWS